MRTKPNNNIWAEAVADSKKFKCSIQQILSYYVDEGIITEQAAIDGCERRGLTY